MVAMPSIYSRGRRWYPLRNLSMEPKVIRAIFITSMVVVEVFPAARAGELTITRVFGPEVPTGPYKHPASMTELKNGDLYLVYYGGEGEYATDTAVFGSRLKRGEAKWTPRSRSPMTRFAPSATE